MSITRNQPPDNLDVSSISNEHRVQIGLLNALHDAVKDEKPASEIHEVLNQLTAYSELHFMSEELLMRMYAYPDYDDHVHDHESMTEYLSEIMKTFAAGQDSMVLKTASDMRQFLLAHISTRDEALTEYLTKMQA
ncbi:MAG: hemerythrin family protein [Halobacteria archaeon]|nr:hemerythrin family protein [Halobacteria archaeon]